MSSTDETTLRSFQLSRSPSPTTSAPRVSPSAVLFRVRSKDTSVPVRPGMWSPTSSRAAHLTILRYSVTPLHGPHLPVQAPPDRSLYLSRCVPPRRDQIRPSSCPIDLVIPPLIPISRPGRLSHRSDLATSSWSTFACCRVTSHSAGARVLARWRTRLRQPRDQRLVPQVAPQCVSHHRITFTTDL